MTAPMKRMPQPYDVIAVCPGFKLDDRDLTCIRLTICAVSLDGHEVDATEWTGGPVIHLCESEFRLVSPPRGSWS